MLCNATMGCWLYTSHLPQINKTCCIPSEDRRIDLQSFFGSVRSACHKDKKEQHHWEYQTSAMTTTCHYSSGLPWHFQPPYFAGTASFLLSHRKHRGLPFVGPACSDICCIPSEDRRIDPQSFFGSVRSACHKDKKEQHHWEYQTSAMTTTCHSSSGLPWHFQPPYFAGTASFLLSRRKHSWSNICCIPSEDRRIDLQSFFGSVRNACHKDKKEQQHWEYQTSAMTTTCHYSSGLPWHFQPPYFAGTASFLLSRRKHSWSNICCIPSEDRRIDLQSFFGSVRSACHKDKKEQHHWEYQTSAMTTTSHSSSGLPWHFQPPYFAGTASFLLSRRKHRRLPFVGPACSNICCIPSEDRRIDLQSFFGSVRSACHKDKKEQHHWEYQTSAMTTTCHSSSGLPWHFQPPYFAGTASFLLSRRKHSWSNICCIPSEDRRIDLQSFFGSVRNACHKDKKEQHHWEYQTSAMTTTCHSSSGLLWHSQAGLEQSCSSPDSLQQIHVDVHWKPHLVLLPRWVSLAKDWQSTHPAKETWCSFQEPWFSKVDCN